MGSEIAFVLGTRPEIIKLSPLLRACDDRGISYTVIHTGQHYSDSLDSVFFEQLELREPDYNLRVGSGNHGEQTGEMIIGIEEILLDEEPDIVLVQGDTNSVLAGSIAASKLDVELGHVEAGLRSFDEDMPEETNRVLADHTADYLFAPTERSEQYLRQEGVSKDQIFVTGNTIVGAVQQNRELAAEKSTILRDYEFDTHKYALMTAHRAENVDDEERFVGILNGAEGVAREFDIEVIYPIHPRASERIDEFGMDVPEGVRLTEPCDYLDFLRLEQEASLILTDSGGVQEEACILGVPCITLRDNTERPETVEVGANRIVGTNPSAIVEAAREMIDRVPNWQNPFGDGTAATEIVETITHAPKIEASR